MSCYLPIDGGRRTGHKLWCNSYRRRKWTRRHEFKSWTWLIAFYIAQNPLGKVWIRLFSFQPWINCRADWILQPWWGNLSRRRSSLNSNPLNSSLKIVLVSYSTRAEGFGKYGYIPFLKVFVLSGMQSASSRIRTFVTVYISYDNNHETTDHHHHHHHHHHLVPVAHISLTLSRHFSLSFIASGRSSGLHSVSSHSCWMYVRAGRPAFARPYVAVYGLPTRVDQILFLRYMK